eukprot:649036-Rhodomonas_salina.1
MPNARSSKRPRTSQELAPTTRTCRKGPRWTIGKGEQRAATLEEKAAYPGEPLPLRVCVVLEPWACVLRLKHAARVSQTLMQLAASCLVLARVSL